MDRTGTAATGAASSRASLSAALDELEDLATRTQAPALAETADEILAVAAVLERESRLRRALCDPSRTGSDRANLLGSLIDARVGADPARLLRTLAAGRWASSAELVNSAERLGVEALLASADRAGELAEVEDELFRFGQVVEGHNELAAALGNSAAPPAQRAGLVRALLTGKVRSATLRLAEVALKGFGGRGLSASLTRLVELAAARRDRQVAYVHVATPLSEADERRLGEQLSRLYRRAMDLKVSVEPGLLGGMSVRVGHDLYDGTVARRLTQARTALASIS